MLTADEVVMVIPAALSGLIVVGAVVDAVRSVLNVGDDHDCDKGADVGARRTHVSDQGHGG